MTRLKRGLKHMRFAIFASMFHYSFIHSLLAVSPKYVSEHVFSGHLTKYVRSYLCSSFVWSFMSNTEQSFLLIYTGCAV